MAESDEHRSRKLRNTAVGQRLKQPLRAALAHVGLEISAIERPATARLRRLLERVQPDVLLDVGANQGQFAMHARTVGYAGPILSIEPVEAAYELLSRNSASDRFWTTRQVAVGHETGNAEVQVARNSVSSSLLKPTTTHVSADVDSRIKGTSQVKIQPLDDIVATDQFARAWLKVDVQGAESSVLAGAERTLARTAILQCELSVCELYEGQELYVPMLQRLEDLGFTLADMEAGLRDPSTLSLLQFDGVFVRDWEELRAHYSN